MTEPMPFERVAEIDAHVKRFGPARAHPKSEPGMLREAIAEIWRLRQLGYDSAAASERAGKLILDRSEAARIQRGRAEQAEAQLSHLRAKANEMLQHRDGDKTATAGIRATMGQILLELLDEAQRAATAGPAAMVANHAYEGAPGAGSACQAEAFGDTCSAPWEQHEMRETGAH